MNKQKGFSLIEVLVTMLIISVGLLGIAGIIVNSMKSNHSAHSRSEATVLANDIIDRMRANRSVAEQAPSPYALALEAAPDATAGVPGADLAEWRTALAAGLPSGVGAVAFNAANRNVTVTVQWNDSRAGGDGETVGLEAQQLVLETHL
jgi:type IV pilus assembly protein PilV